MDEQLIQEAAQTFCVVPEIYQQAFKQAGADFPDELVQQIKAKPDEAVKMLQSDKGLLDGVVQIYSKYKKEIDQAATQATQQKGLFKKGGKLDYLVNKFQDGGKAKRFYSAWSEGDIRKLQNALFARGYYDGDLDGKVGPQTIAAVKKYQQAHNLSADGMWGFNTDTQERILGSDITNRGRYAKSHKTEQGTLVQHNGNPDYSTTIKDVKPDDFQNFELYYYGHPEEFFDESNQNASRWRQIMHNSGKDGEFFINRIYGLLSPEQRKSVDNRLKTHSAKDHEDEQTIKENREEAQKAALGVLGAGFSMPFMIGTGAGAVLANGARGALSLIGSAAGGALGGRVGQNVGQRIGQNYGLRYGNHTNQFGYDNLYHDPDSEFYGVAGGTYDPNYFSRYYGDRYGNYGNIAGTIAGTAIGGLAGDWVGKTFEANQPAVATVDWGARPKTRAVATTEDAVSTGAKAPKEIVIEQATPSGGSIPNYPEVSPAAGTTGAAGYIEQPMIPAPLGDNVKAVTNHNFWTGTPYTRYVSTRSGRYVPTQVSVVEQSMAAAPSRATTTTGLNLPATINLPATTTSAGVPATIGGVPTVRSNFGVAEWSTPYAGGSKPISLARPWWESMPDNYLATKNQ